ncbi:MAG: DUF6599 family protein [Candidatus Aminicenantales bacterium]
MAEIRRWRAAAALLVFLMTAASAAPVPARQEALSAYLPADGAAPGWVKDGDPQEFVGEDLYTYIDGGAEIYREYGFRRVVLQDYKDGSGKSVSLEIFEMETPEAAYGIFTFKRSGKGKSVPLGSGGDLEDYYLNFWKGRFLATLTGFDETPATIDGLLAVAGAVDARIRDKADLPDLVAVLPGRGLKPGSVKYLKGRLGLDNVYPFYTARGLGFKAAVKGDYEDGSCLIVMDYASVEVRDKAWADLRAYLESTDRFKRSGAADAAVPLFQDGKGRYVAFTASGPRLRVGISPDSSASIAIVRQSR